MVSGFTIVRNAVKLDYPFREAVLSILPLCDEVVINVGDSTDGTVELCERLRDESGGRVRLIHSIWDTEGQSGGRQLKVHTDGALRECRGDWCLYIQADEALHEEDHGAIRQALWRAQSRTEIDALVFDYLHFYGNYDYVISGRHWYRREVRLFKNGRGIESFRDAQGFRRQGNRLEAIDSSARVFHYGHVRSRQTRRAKNEEMSRWWGETPASTDEAVQPRRHFGIRRFRKSHPAVMAERLRRNEEYFDPTRCPRRWNAGELKNLFTVAWETLVPYRIGEFRNYELRP